LERELLLANEHDIEEGVLKRVTTDDFDFCVTRIDGKVRVVEDRCPHMSVPLSYGTLEGCVVTCPQHRAQFDMLDCSVVGPPVMGQTRAPEAQPLDPEQAARLARRAEMMGAVRTKPLLAFGVIQRDGNVYAVLPNEA
jgi:nitrite reductase/ring-hydroxylating ferredoxin subunit